VPFNVFPFLFLLVCSRRLCDFAFVASVAVELLADHSSDRLAGSTGTVQSRLRHSHSLPKPAYAQELKEKDENRADRRLRLLYRKRQYAKLATEYTSGT
jgi:hypothetical protein